jgi:Ran GTPase-activating protein (RanGAP) involved in mRNA processing and transport
LKPNKGCFELKLKQNWFTNEGLKHLGDALAVNKGLKRLYLGNNKQIGDEGCILLASSLKRSTTLGVLDLTNCDIGSKGAKALGAALALNKSLHTLYLSENPAIGVDGMKELAAGLVDNKKLKILDVGNCGIGDDGCIALAELLSKSNVVEQLFLRKNNISEKGSAALADSLANKNRSLKLLNLDYNTIGDVGARPFMLAIRENDVIEKIEFDDKSISDDWKLEFRTRLARKQA